jgi:hypothetical protein
MRFFAQARAFLLLLSLLLIHRIHVKAHATIRDFFTHWNDGSSSRSHSSSGSGSSGESRSNRDDSSTSLRVNVILIGKLPGVSHEAAPGVYLNPQNGHREGGLSQAWFPPLHTHATWAGSEQCAGTYRSNNGRRLDDHSSFPAYLFKKSPLQPDEQNHFASALETQLRREVHRQQDSPEDQKKQKSGDFPEPPEPGLPIDLEFKYFHAPSSVEEAVRRHWEVLLEVQLILSIACLLLVIARSLARSLVIYYLLLYLLPYETLRQPCTHIPTPGPDLRT